MDRPVAPSAPLQILVARQGFASLAAMRHLVLCLLLALAAPAFSAELKIDFSDFPEGSSPTNFHGAVAGGGKTGDWKILLDEVPPLFAPLTDKA